MTRPSGSVDEQAIYAKGLRALVTAQVPFLVGGGWGLFAFIGQWRATKDIDLFVRPKDVVRTLAVLAEAGFDCDLLDASWLGKALLDGALIDIIFCSYNGLFPVDDSWFANGRAAEVLGVPVRVVGPEEMLVSKAFVAARDRFDGGDVSWLIRATAGRLDWSRIEWLMRDHWQVLLFQLVHFVYVFPAGRRLLPPDLLPRLLSRFGDERLPDEDAPLVCRGALLDPKLYRGEVDAPLDDAPIVAADEG